MASRPSPEIDDELFNEVYGKAYSGPPGSTTNNGSERAKSNERYMSNDQSDEDDEPSDPNAIPTDFTSREAKVWEAKAKATERNWKKRKEEEMICKICGESGHFTQGCPSTLGANRKSADFIERVAARDKHVRSLFSEKVIHRIENDVGCKIKMDDKFLVVSGKNRLIVKKGVDAVHKVIQEGDKGERRGNPSPDRMRSKSRSRSPGERRGVSQLRHSESQKSHSSPRNASYFSQKNYIQERAVEEQMREDLRKLSRGSPQAYNNDGASRHPVHSKSPPPASFSVDAYNSYDSSSRNGGTQKSDNWNTERRGPDFRPGYASDFSSHPPTLEDLEMEFKKEAMECGRIRDKEEDEENHRHRECIREIRENYMKKLSIMRGVHTQQWEGFLQLETQRQHQQRYNVYNQPGYSDNERLSANHQYAGKNISMDSRSRYQYPGEEYSASRSYEAYGEYQRQRYEDFGQSYGRY